MRVGLKGRLDRLRQCQRGNVAIEFAIVSGCLMLVLGAIIEVGIFMLIQFNLQNVAETASRRIRTNQVTAATSLSTFKNDICADIIVSNCTTRVFVDVRNANTFTNLRTAIPFSVNTPPSVGPGVTETFLPGGTGQWGSLIITYDWDFHLPFIDTLFGNLPGGNRRLFGIAIYRNET